MKILKYKGVDLEVPEKAPKFTHSVSMMLATLGKSESNANIPYFERLIQYKEMELPEGELLHDVCALNSIRHMNYQINNGGFLQYYDNGYHEYQAGYEIGDLALLAIDEQISFLKVLVDFILLDDANKCYEDDLQKVITLFEAQWKNIIEYEHYEHENAEYAELNGCDEFDTQWYKVSDVIESGMELYAQYLIKRLEGKSDESSD